MTPAVQIDAADDVVLGVGDEQRAARAGQPLGPASVAARAGPPSPVWPCSPVPATWWIVAVRRRCGRWRCPRAAPGTDRPSPSMASVRGPLSGVPASGAPSGVGCRSPVPPIVSMTPVARSTRADAVVADVADQQEPPGRARRRCCAATQLRRRCRAAVARESRLAGARQRRDAGRCPLRPCARRGCRARRRRGGRARRTAISCGMLSAPAVAGPPSPA